MELHEYWHDNEGFIFLTQSQNNKEFTYTISTDIYDGWYCTCDDYKFRKHKCKHIREAEEYIKHNYPSEYLKYHNLTTFV